MEQRDNGSPLFEITPKDGTQVMRDSAGNEIFITAIHPAGNTPEGTDRSIKEGIEAVERELKAAVERKDAFVFLANRGEEVVICGAFRPFDGLTMAQTLFLAMDPLAEHLTAMTEGAKSDAPKDDNE